MIYNLSIMVSTFAKLRRVFGIYTANDRAKAYNAERIADNNTLKERMKPKDGTRGYMFDPDKPQGVIVPVNKVVFLKEYENPKKGKEGAINRNQVRSCSKAFNDNNNMHLMITVYVDESNKIRLLEGNHRLELLRQGSQDTILVNVINNSGYSDKEFDNSVETLIEKCGAPDAKIERHGEVVFCNIDYNGHFAYIFEERMTAPYFTINRNNSGELTSAP